MDVVHALLCFIAAKCKPFSQSSQGYIIGSVEIMHTICPDANEIILKNMGKLMT